MSTCDKMIEKVRKDTLVRGSAIAVGNFDGFHLGHRKIIAALKTIAADRNLVSIILTFAPNPRVYFNRERSLIVTGDRKKKILEQQGVDHVVILDFARIADMPGKTFLQQYLLETFHMQHIAMGENFRFGKDRQGDIAFLKTMAQQYRFRLTVVKPVLLEDRRISSTAIRDQLANAQIEISNRMLGRQYFIEGVVSEGDKIGRQLGFPTINLDTENTLLPEGVFQTRVKIENDRQVYHSITYIGYRPTFMGKEKKVESHIFDFDRKIYGKKVTIYFEKKLRNDMKFDSQGKLINQIQQDIENLKVDKGCIF